MTVDELWHSQTDFHPNIGIELPSRDRSRVSDCLEADSSRGKISSPRERLKRRNGSQAQSVD